MGPGRCGAGGPNEATASTVGWKCIADAAGVESEPASGGVQADTRDCGPCGFAAEIFCADGGNVCGAGIDFGFAGNIWRDLIFGDTTDAGDRYPDGSGGNAGTCADKCHLEDALAGDAWDRSGRSCVDGDGQFDCIDAVWDDSYGPGYIPGHAAFTRSGGSAGWIYSCT